MPPATVADFSPLTARAATPEVAGPGQRHRLHRRAPATTSSTPRADLGRGTRAARRLTARASGVHRARGRHRTSRAGAASSRRPTTKYLVDAAFDDTLPHRPLPLPAIPTSASRRRGSTSSACGAGRARATSARVERLLQRLEGLVASVPFGLNPDSTFFGNTDFGTVKGVELSPSAELRDGMGIPPSTYTLQSAWPRPRPLRAPAARIRVAAGHRRHRLPGAPRDPPRLRPPSRPHRGPSAEPCRSAAGPRARHAARRRRASRPRRSRRFASGTPLRWTPRAIRLVGLPNSHRLPSQSHGRPPCVRRPLRIGALRGSVYSRRAEPPRTSATSSPCAAIPRPARARAPRGQAHGPRLRYHAHPEAIPYESPRYRRWADLDHNG